MDPIVTQLTYPLPPYCPSLLSLRSVCRVWTPKRTGALRPRRICLPKTKPACASNGVCSSLCEPKKTQIAHKSCMEGCAIYCDLK